MRHLPVLADHTPAQPLAEAPPERPDWIGPRGERTEWLELHLTYTCPERCLFCSEEHRMRRYKPYPVTWGRTATVIREHARRGVRRVHLTGGEPTIHPRFVDTLKLAKKLGMRTSVGTIGTMLARRDFAERALPFLDEALFSLHGPSPEVHDAMAGREGSFAQVTKALRLSREVAPRFHPYVNIVMTRKNVAQLPETVALAASLGAELVVISNLTPEGLGLDAYEELAVPLDRLAEVLPRLPALAGDVPLRFFGVPMCLLGPHRMLSNDLHWDPRVTVEWADAGPDKVRFADHYNWDPGRKRIHVEECEPCAMKGVCMGVFDRYAELYSTDALKPETKAEVNP